MVTLTASSVVLVRFPFSDLSQSKLRPAVVLAVADRGDWILCQITSKPYGDFQSITLTDSSFVEGALHVDSYVRPRKLFTANEKLIVATVGTLHFHHFEQVIEAVVSIFQTSLSDCSPKA